MSKHKTPLEPSNVAAVANLYHQELMTVKAIAAKLRLDRRKVDAALEEIKRQRLVSIAEPMKVDESLEAELYRRFKLLKVTVVPSPPITTPQDYADLLRRWGQYAADYFEELAAATAARALRDKEQKRVTSSLRVGISGGETLFEFVNAIQERSRPFVEIYTTALVGRSVLLSSTSHIDPIVNATLLWSKCGRHGNNCQYATVPPHKEDLGDDWGYIRSVIDTELRSLVTRPSIKQILEAMDDLDVAFVGLGLVKPDTTDPAHINRLTMMSLLKPISRTIPTHLHHDHAIGDIAYCLFDKHGATAPDWTFFLTAGHSDTKSGFSGAGYFKQMVERRKPVVVMAGAYKEPAVLCALRARLFNVWFTDEAAARKIIALDDATRSGTSVSHE